MMKIFSRIGVSVIFSRHLQTFYNYGHYEWKGEKKVVKSDIYTFLVLPLVISALLVFLDNKIVTNFSELIITSLSIFVGLLFSLLTLVFDLAKKEKERLKAIKTEDLETKEIAAFTLIKELFVNIAYSIGLSIFCIIMVFLAEFRPTIIISLIKDKEYFELVRDCYIYISNALVVFFLLEFTLTLLMILRRFFIVFNKQIETD